MDSSKGTPTTELVAPQDASVDIARTNTPTGLVEAQDAPLVKRKAGNPFKIGHPKFGGRKKGCINTRTKYAREIAEKMGIDPIEFMLYVLGSDTMEESVVDQKTGVITKRTVVIPLETRLDAAKCIANYVYPKLQATQITGKDDGPLDVALDIATLLADPTTAKAAQELALKLAQAEQDKASTSQDD